MLRAYGHSEVELAHDAPPSDFSEDLLVYSRRLRDPGPLPDVTVAWRGEPAPDKVVRVARLMKAHRVDFAVLAAVHGGNVDRPVDVYRFLRDEVGTRFIQLAPVAADGVAQPIGSDAWGRFLIAIFDEWVRHDIGTVFVRIFDEALRSRLSPNAGTGRGDLSGGPFDLRSRAQPTPFGGRDGGDLDAGYHAFCDHVSRHWSRDAVRQL